MPARKTRICKELGNRKFWSYFFVCFSFLICRNQTSNFFGLSQNRYSFNIPNKTIVDKLSIHWYANKKGEQKMKLFYRVVCCLLIIPLFSLTSGCASYRFGRLPSPYINDHSSPITQKDVSVAVEFLGYSQADSTFDCELTKKQVTPAYIVIDNKSSNAYGFRKADVDSSYLPAEEVAKKCARSTMGRLLGYSFLVLVPFVWIVFLPMLIGEMINCPTINSRMKNDYITNEIADTTIASNRSISGIMFVAPLRSGQTFTIPLTNRNTGEKLLFQFQNNQQGAISSESPQEKKETRERKEPNQNFGY